MSKVAQYQYNATPYDGTNDVMCYCEKVANNDNLISYKVIANSPTGNVAFIEFGAGNGKVNSLVKEHPFRETIDFPLKELGQYGAGNGSADYWVFKQRGAIKRPTQNLMAVWSNSFGGHYRVGYYWTAGNKPSRAMWRAHLYFIKNFKDIVEGNK